MLLSAAMVLAFLSAAEQASLGDEIVAYARSKLGEKVGGGQCSDLAFEALEAAGADPFDRSSRRASLADARPGDVLAFRGAEFRGRSGRGRTYWYRFEEHVAIVVAVHADRDAPRVTVLHQNVGLAKDTVEKRERVTEQTLNLADLKEGELAAYAPRPRPSAPFDRLRAADDADDRP